MLALVIALSNQEDVSLVLLVYLSYIGSGCLAGYAVLSRSVVQQSEDVARVVSGSIIGISSFLINAFVAKLALDISLDWMTLLSLVAGGAVGGLVSTKSRQKKQGLGDKSGDLRTSR